MDCNSISTNHRRPTPHWLWPLLSFIATRVYLLGFFHAALTSDVNFYFDYAVNTVDIGYAPYTAEMHVEYPPLAYWVIAAPRWFDSRRVDQQVLERGELPEFFRDYTRAIHVEMFVCDLVAFLLFLGIVLLRRPELLVLSAWGYVLSTTLLAHVLYDRLDAALLMLVLAWAYCWLRVDRSRWPVPWQVLSYLWLGLGISFKLIPILIVPFAVVADARAIRNLRALPGFILGLVVLLLAAAGPFAMHYQSSQGGVLGLFRLHSDRMIEVESLWGTAVWLLRTIWPAAAKHDTGSWNIVSAISPALMEASKYCLLAWLALLGALACWPWRAFDRTSAYRTALLALLGALVLTKVLSVQFFVWGLPLALLLAAERLPQPQFALVLGMALAIAALSTWVFPYLFFTEYQFNGRTIVNSHALIPRLDWLPCTLLAVRNGLLAGLVVWLAKANLGRPPAGREPKPAATI